MVAAGKDRTGAYWCIVVGLTMARNTAGFRCYTTYTVSGKKATLFLEYLQQM